jgi:hypothetical protein
MWIRTLVAAGIIDTAPALAQTQNTNWPNYREDNFIVTDYKFASGGDPPSAEARNPSMPSSS